MRQVRTFIAPRLFLAPDGAGGGGAPPGEIPLKEWIGRLEAAGEKDRNAVVEELAKTLGVKTGDAYKTLRAAGWNPEGPDDKNRDPGKAAKKPQTPAARKTVQVFLRHKTPHPRYRRAGLLLTNRLRPYAVTAEQLAALKKDSWVEVREAAGPDKP
jgi:hypothetical protein